MSSDPAPVGGSQEDGTERPVAQAPSSIEPQQGRDEAPPTERWNLLILSLASFCLICFGVWLFSAGKRYREEHASSAQGWRVGGSRAVEVTLVKEDMQTLACASDQSIAGLRCGGDRPGHEGAPDPRILQPYNTVGNEIFLGAGLWNSPNLKGPLPNDRFTVVCNYHVQGFLKSATIRFGATGTFTPLGKTTPVGTLTDCTIPR